MSCAAQFLLILGLTQGCKSDDDVAAPYECVTTAIECLEDLSGTYEGTYAGSTQGTWEAVLHTDGGVTGIYHDKAAGHDLFLDGQTDEYGNAVFGDGSLQYAFAGRINADFTISGTWSAVEYSGTFGGRRVSSGSSD